MYIDFLVSNFTTSPNLKKNEASSEADATYGFAPIKKNGNILRKLNCMIAATGISSIKSEKKISNIESLFIR